MLIAALALAALALAMGWVRPGEAPGLLDLHVLSLFFVLIVAAECAKRSELFTLGVRTVLSRVHSSRGLAAAAILVTGATAALVTNDVALFLIVPFTLAFETASPGFDATAIVILEIQASNLLGCLTPTGNPQNLFLYTFGGFTPGGFLAAQAPWVTGMTLATLAVAPFLVPARVLSPPEKRTIAVEPTRAAAALVLVALELLAIFRLVPAVVPVVATLPVLFLLGRDLLKTDFTLIAVFAALFVGVEGLRRSPLFHVLDPTRLFGESPSGFVLSGALLSQFVSNVPAALLLAPAAAAHSAMTALLYGVNAGGCGTPIASLANLIGARLYLAEKNSARRFWKVFLLASGALLVVATGLSLLLVKYSVGLR